MSLATDLARTHVPAYLPNPPLASVLCDREAAKALQLFRRHLDTVQIASRMGCTPAAAANALARARDEERRAVA